MSAIIFKAGATSKTIDVWIQDSSSTTGGGLSGLVYNSAGLTAYYRKGATGSATAITLATQTVGGAYSSGGFVEIDATNMKGLYRLDLPNAAIDTAGLTHIVLRGATNMAPVAVRVQCVAFDPDDSVRLGLTALPNAAAGANGGLPTGDANAAVKFQAGTGTGQLDFTSGVVKANTVQWLGTACSTPTTAGVPNVNAKTWNDLATVALPLVPTVPGRTLDVSLTGEAGIDWANLGSPTTAVDLSGTTISTSQVAASVTGAVGSVTGAVGSVTGNVGGNVAGSVGSVTGAVGSVTGAVGSVTGAVGSVAAGGITAASFGAGAIDAAALATDAVSEIADGILGRNVSGGSSTGRTVKQALHFLRNKWVIGGGTLTVYDTDDVTSSWTATITTAAGDPVSTSDPA